MADTRQIVQWALEHSCPLRSSPASHTQPDNALGSVGTARAYSAAVRRREEGFGIFDGVYVSSHSYGVRPGGRKAGASPPYPESGFVIAHEFAALGGAEELFRLCHTCPVNVLKHEIASCTGTLEQWPNSPDTETQLQGIISRLGLGSTMEASFRKTSPLWYGLWAVSPVPAASLPVLGTLLREMLTEDRQEMAQSGKTDQRQLTEFSTAVTAIELAERNGLRLHVRLLPLGHTDFGFYTIFPHCPFCKAAARVAHWQRRYPTERHICHVCGTQFSPAETASTQRRTFNRDSLRDKLGSERFRQFAKAYLVAHGEPSEMADQIILETEAREAERLVKQRLGAEMHRRRTAYLENHIYVGLPCLPVPPDHLSDEDEDTPAGSTGWFAAPNFTEVLHRCAAHGIKVTMMLHVSADGTTDRDEMKNLSAPLTLLAIWQAEGCNGQFYAGCKVPDALVANPPPSA